MRTPRDNDRRLLGFAKEMRQEPTDAERKMWWILRSRKLAGFKFRRQVPVGGYILDFFCVKQRLSVEVDGDQHNEPAGIKYDGKRTEKLSDLGIRVVRFSDVDVLKFPEAVCRTLYRHLTEATAPGGPTSGFALRPSPQPSPGVPGEGEERGGSR